MIKSIHKECDDYIDWNLINCTEPPFLEGEIGPNENEAINKLNSYRPNFMQKSFKFLNLEGKAKDKLIDNIEKAKTLDRETYQNWYDLKITSDKILNGDIDEYLKVISDMNPLEDLLEFGSGFEFFAYDSSNMEIEFIVNSNVVVPKEHKAITNNGKLSIKQMSSTMYYDILQDYVCSCALRIARDLFALLPLNNVYVHAMDESINTINGLKEKNCLLSVNFDKTKLNVLDFENIDCSDSMANFEHNMKFLKTKGLQAVNKLNVNIYA